MFLYEAFEETGAQAAVQRDFARDHWGQLFVVTDDGDVASALGHWD